jgi:lysine 2,3-aminomutase
MIFAVARSERSMEGLRRRLCALSEQMEFETFTDYSHLPQGSIIRVRDCARMFTHLLKKRSEDLSGFSIAKAIRDIARGKSRPELSPAFYADLLHILLGLQGRGPGKSPADEGLETSRMTGRKAAVVRSRQLDRLWKNIDKKLAGFPHGLRDAAQAYRKKRRQRILRVLNATEKEWHDWRWQLKNVIRDADALEKLLVVSKEEKKAVREACRLKLPFGITPYFLTLMHDETTPIDQSIRAQVIPTLDYVRKAAGGKTESTCDMDFMRERDTSPVDLITRRYPAIVIFKPYNTCPQICVYCQRNWEIENVMAPGAMARREQIDKAVDWIRSHPAVHEVLITGGDPLMMSNTHIRKILKQIAAIPSIEHIRIGTRMPVTLPMRINDQLSRIFGSFRRPGKREIVVVTHIQHPYEITPDTVKAVERLRRQGIPVCNQLVFTFFVSRRFEAAALRRTLRLAGITPYYTFNTKGKYETAHFRVPIARLLQEQKEEARLLPGMARTDEAVYNVPGMGKNYLRARQHRSMLSILPDGSRVYEYHPWEKNISGTHPLSTFITRDVPILEYLERLEKFGENMADYQTIWYYY